MTKPSYSLIARGLESARTAVSRIRPNDVKPAQRVQIQEWLTEAAEHFWTLHSLPDDAQAQIRTIMNSGKRI